MQLQAAQPDRPRTRSHASQPPYQAQVKSSFWVSVRQYGFCNAAAPRADMVSWIYSDPRTSVFVTETPQP